MPSCAESGSAMGYTPSKHARHSWSSAPSSPRPVPPGRRSPASRHRSTGRSPRWTARSRSARPGWRSRCRRSTARSPAGWRSARGPRAAPASRSIRTRARWVLPRTIESSTTTSRLPRDDLPQRVELEPDAELADGLRRLDERPADVGVLHQARAVRDARLLGEADGGGSAGLGHGDHQVGLDRVLPGEAAADLDPGRVHAAAARCGCRGGPGRRTRTGSPSGPPRRTGASAGRASSMATSSPGSISRTYDAPTMSSAAVSLATTQPRSQPAEHQRPDALRVAGGVERRSSMKTSEKAPRSCGSTLSGGLLERGRPGRRRAAR